MADLAVSVTFAAMFNVCVSISTTKKSRKLGKKDGGARDCCAHCCKIDKNLFNRIMCNRHLRIAYTVVARRVTYIPVVVPE
jgi:hypothetical protein